MEIELISRKSINWNILLLTDVYSSQTMVYQFLIELFYPLQAQQNLGQQYEFSDRQASQWAIPENVHTPSMYDT